MRDKCVVDSIHITQCETLFSTDDSVLSTVNSIHTTDTVDNIYTTNKCETLFSTTYRMLSSVDSIHTTQYNFIFYR